MQPLKIRNGYAILLHIFLGMWLSINVGIKLIHVSKRDPRSSRFEQQVLELVTLAKWWSNVTEIVVATENNIAVIWLFPC